MSVPVRRVGTRIVAGLRCDHRPGRLVPIVHRHGEAHTVELTLECGCHVHRVKSREPKRRARCAHPAGVGTEEML